MSIAESPSLDDRVEPEVLDAFKEATRRDDVTPETVLAELTMDDEQMNSWHIHLEDNVAYFPEFRRDPNFFTLPDVPLKQVRTVRDVIHVVRDIISDMLRKVSKKETAR